MADINSSLPVRTESAGDLEVKIVDGTLTTQVLTVNPDGSVNVTDNGGSLTVDATDLDIRSLTSATDSVEVLQASHDNLNANANIQVGDVDVSDMNPVPVSDAGGSLTVDATDLDIRALTDAEDKVAIGDGSNTLAINSDGSINVVPQEAPGDEITNFDVASNIAGGAVSEHTHTVQDDAKLFQILASASGKMKIEVQIETGAGTGVFDTIAVAFNSTANPNIDLAFKNHIFVENGAIIKIVRTNKEVTAQDMFSTICVIEG